MSTPASERRTATWKRHHVALIARMHAERRIGTRAAAQWMRAEDVPEHVALRVLAGREVRHV